MSEEKTLSVEQSLSLSVKYIETSLKLTQLAAIVCGLFGGWFMLGNEVKTTDPLSMPRVYWALMFSIVCLTLGHAIFFHKFRSDQFILLAKDLACEGISAKKSFDEATRRYPNYLILAGFLLGVAIVNYVLLFWKTV